MSMMTRRAARTLGSVLLALTVACDRSPQLDVRTFTVEHLNAGEVEMLLYPYVYQDRPEAPGAITVTAAAVTVRETPDNLDRIAAVLAERDVARPDVRLVFQLIEADGFTETDPRIVAVTDQLRSVFQFSGYRLAGEAMLSVTDQSEMQQQLRGSDGVYRIFGRVSWAGPGTLRLEDVTLSQGDRPPVLRTTVNVRPGQTLVLGSSPRTDSSATLLLTVRAEEVP